MSHEVRTPMAGVIGVVELMSVQAKDDEMRELSKLALESCKRLLQILNDLLDASKLQAGALRIENRRFSIRALIADLTQLAKAETDKKNIAISHTVEASVPEQVCGDELRVRQILQNLLSNAIKFTAEGSIKISVEVTQQTSDVTTLKLSIVDTGVGINDAHKADLFEPFVQAEDSTARIYGGTGLGLHICRTLTELMNGEIGFYSEAGKGSTFWCCIPFREMQCPAE